MDDRVKPLTEQQALEAIRRAGEVDSISALAQMLGWERTKTSRTVPKWEHEGEIVRKRGPGGKVVIIALVAGTRLLRTLC